MYEYTLLRSNRKTMSLEVKEDGTVLVRAPMKLARERIDRFVLEHEAWIANALRRQKERAEKFSEPDEAERQHLIEIAAADLPGRVAKYARIMGVTPAGVSITGAKTRFGSCSPKNRLCFSWRLMRYPEPAIDYVVVHELAHIRHKNHGHDFYAFVESVLPDYREREKLLR